jgi:hypothetical protein
MPRILNTRIIPTTRRPAFAEPRIAARTWSRTFERTNERMDAHHLSGECGKSGKRSGHGYSLRHIKSPWSNAIGGDADALVLRSCEAGCRLVSDHALPFQNDMPLVQSVCDHMSSVSAQVRILSDLHVIHRCAEVRTSRIGVSISVRLPLACELATILQLPVSWARI